MRVADPGPGQGARQRRPAEVRMAARSRKAAHVDQQRDLELGEPGEELLERARGVADGQHQPLGLHAAGRR